MKYHWIVEDATIDSGLYSNKADVSIAVGTRVLKWIKIETEAEC